LKQRFTITGYRELYGLTELMRPSHCHPLRLSFMVLELERLTKAYVSTRHRNVMRLFHNSKYQAFHPTNHQLNGSTMPVSCCTMWDTQPDRQSALYMASRAKTTQRNGRADSPIQPILIELL